MRPLQRLCPHYWTRSGQHAKGACRFCRLSHEDWLKRRADTAGAAVFWFALALGLLLAAATLALCWPTIAVKWLIVAALLCFLVGLCV